MTKTCDNWHPDRDRELQILNGLQVLVVDDDIDSLDLLVFILQEYGVRVLTAKSAPQALEMLGQFKLDLLISDIAMPGENGYELIRKVRTLKASQTREIPAIALTACLLEEGRTLALESGFQVYLTKPVEPCELVAVVANVVRFPDEINMPLDRGLLATSVIEIY